MGKLLRLFLTALPLLTLIATPAVADPADLDWGIGVSTVFFGHERTATLAPGETIIVHVLTDRLAAEYGDAMRACQFALMVDPRLEILARSPAIEAVITGNRGPDEWLLGFMDCIENDRNPFVLMSYTLQLPADVVDIADLRIDVGHLLSTGERMAFTTCRDDVNPQPLQDAGGVVLNPSNPSIINFIASPEVMVEGRGAHLVWETVADETRLDGTITLPIQRVAVSPVVDTSYELIATTGPSSVAQGVNIEVIRRPRVNYFTAVPAVYGSSIRMQLAWEVLGTDIVDLESEGGSLGNHPAIASAVVALVEPPVYMLHASNEWGTSSAVAEVEDIGSFPPFILGFSAAPNPFVSGQDVTLSYELFNADSATLEPGFGSVDPVSGEIVFQPSASTSYTLTASNANGTVEQAIFLQLLPAGIHSFVADPDEIFAGRSTTLRWDVNAGLDLNISPDVGAVLGETGEVTVTPAADNTIYTLTASNAESSVSADALVQWKLPVAGLAVDNAAPYATDAVVFTVTLDGADSATLEPGFGSIDPGGGNFQTVVEAPTTFVLTATNAKGSVTSQAFVDPQLPDAALSASSTTVFPGESFTLTAQIQGADAASLEPGFGAIDPAGGSFESSISTTTNFVLEASNARGSVQSQLQVEVLPPEILAFTAAPGQILAGNSSTLSWDVAGATEILIPQLALSTGDAAGSVLVSPVETTVYDLVAENSAGSDSAVVTVEVLPFAIVSFTATPDLIFDGESALLEWEIVGSGSASIDGFGPQPFVGSLEVFPHLSTDFVLRVSSGAIERTATASVTVRPDSEPMFLLSWEPDVFPGDAPSAGALTPFTMYVVGTGLEPDLFGYEFRLHYPPTLFVLATQFPGQDTAQRFGTGGDFLVGTGICIQPGPIITLLALTFLSFDEITLSTGEISIGPVLSSPSIPGFPAYLTCNEEIIPATTGGPLLLVDLLGGLVHVLSFDLRAQPRSGGVELQWRLPDEISPGSITLTRGREGETAVVVANLEGARAVNSGSYIDEDVRSGVSYVYRAVAVADGQSYASEDVIITLETAATPRSGSRLLANIPNPFNPRTEIRYELAASASPRLEIYDSAGRRVRSVQLPTQPAGIHGWVWTGSDDKGQSVVSGVYHVRLWTGNRVSSRSISLIR